MAAENCRCKSKSTTFIDVAIIYSLGAFSQTSSVRNFGREARCSVETAKHLPLGSWHLALDINSKFIAT